MSIVSITNTDDLIYPEDLDEFIDYYKTELKNDGTLEDHLDFHGDIYGFSDVAIHEDYFAEYIKEFVQDTWDAVDMPDFIFNNIDWDAVADDLRVDYTELSFMGETYYIR